MKIVCPFCQKPGFDLPGLKLHFPKCDGYIECDASGRTLAFNIRFRYWARKSLNAKPISEGVALSTLEITMDHLMSEKSIADAVKKPETIKWIDASVSKTLRAMHSCDYVHHEILEITKATNV